MSYIYITEPGAIVKKDGKRLIIARGTEVLRYISIDSIKQLILMGPVQLTTPARNLCLRYGIDTIFLNRAGAYQGRLIGLQPAYAKLRWEQYKFFHNEEKTLIFVREIVRGKIINQRKLLMKRKKVTPATTEMRRLAEKAAAADSIDIARGLEGRTAALYFGAFDGLITNPDFFFKTRNRQPPKDPVNILLSLGYTILFNRIESIIYQTGLDIALGGLHLPERGKPALALDIQEEFRAVIVDTTVLKCINLKILSKDDFISNKDTIDYLAGEPDEFNRPIMFKKDAMRKFLTYLDKKFESKVFYPPFAAKLTYRDVILQQTRSLIRNINGEEEYITFTPNF